MRRPDWPPVAPVTAGLPWKQSVASTVDLQSIERLHRPILLIASDPPSQLLHRSITRFRSAVNVAQAVSRLDHGQAVSGTLPLGVRGPCVVSSERRPALRHRSLFAHAHTQQTQPEVAVTRRLPSPAAPRIEFCSALLGRTHRATAVAVACEPLPRIGQ
jgi:hypothetical protein